MTIKQFFFKVRHRLIRIMNTPICFKKLNARSPLDIKTYDGGNEGFIPLVYISKKNGMATNSGLFSHHIKE